MDAGTIATALLTLGAFTLFMVLVRRLPPAEDDVAAVVTFLGTPVELEWPPADLEEPVRWRLDLLKPRAVDSSRQSAESPPAGLAQGLGGQNSGWSRS